MTMSSRQSHPFFSSLDRARHMVEALGNYMAKNGLSPTNFIEQIDGGGRMVCGFASAVMRDSHARAYVDMSSSQPNVFRIEVVLTLHFQRTDDSLLERADIVLKCSFAPEVTAWTTKATSGSESPRGTEMRKIWNVVSPHIGKSASADMIPEFVDQLLGLMGELPAR